MRFDQLTAGFAAPFASKAQPDGGGLQDVVNQAEVDHAHDELGVKRVSLIKYGADAAAFRACETGVGTRLTGFVFDGFRQWLARSDRGISPLGRRGQPLVPCLI